MAKFNKPGTRLKVKGIGTVSDVGLTEELARRLIDRNPAYAKIITLGHTTKAKAPSNDKKESTGGDSKKGGDPKPIGAK